HEHHYRYDHGDAKQHDCEELGGWHRCPNEVYQHRNNEHHLHDHNGNGCNGIGLTNGGNGFVEC
ncbi:MAG: hypothetical protein ACKOQP_04250, partial [Bacteroidota bacterium]